MAQLRRPQPPDKNTVAELHRQLEAGDQQLRGSEGGAVRVIVRMGLWQLEGDRPHGTHMAGEIDPTELFAWLTMYGVSFESVVGLFDEYPPGDDGRISTTLM